MTPAMAMQPMRENNNSQNQCGILFPVQEEVNATEAESDRPDQDHR